MTGALTCQLSLRTCFTQAENRSDIRFHSGSNFSSLMRMPYKSLIGLASVAAMLLGASCGVEGPPMGR